MVQWGLKTSQAGNWECHWSEQEMSLKQGRGPWQNFEIIPENPWLPHPWKGSKPGWTRLRPI